MFLIAYNTPLNSFNFNELARGGGVEGGRVVGIDVGNARLDDMAGVLMFGAFFHVLVEPFFTNEEVEFLDQESQLGVKRS